jgi:divalent metal cation (Fe/Co/Zn/Cd) transporter
VTPPLELPTVSVPSRAAGAVVEPGARPTPTITRERFERVAHRVKLLSWLSLAWMTVEGAVAIAVGIAAGSIALVGFGLDSAIEGFASVIIIWRFTGHRVFSDAAEQRAQKLVAIQFFLLAPYVAFESVKGLIAGDHPDVSWIGIALAIGSLILMPILGIAKQRLAEQLGSAATAGEGRQNMLCAYLAGALLIGLLGNAVAGAWWLDPAVGLLIAGVAVKEGVDTWQGEGCCVTSAPGGGVGLADDGCHDDCCAATGTGPDTG